MVGKCRHPFLEQAGIVTCGWQCAEFDRSLLFRKSKAETAKNAKDSLRSQRLKAKKLEPSYPKGGRACLREAVSTFHTGLWISASRIHIPDFDFFHS